MQRKIMDDFLGLKVPIKKYIKSKQNVLSITAGEWSSEFLRATWSSLLIGLTNIEICIVLFSILEDFILLISGRRRLHYYSR